MIVNPMATKYKVLISATDGEAINVTKALTQLTPEEQTDEMGARVTGEVANVRHGSGSLSDLCRPGCGVFVFADWGAGMQETFRGVLWDWSGNDDSSAKVLQFTAYDMLIYLQKSKDNRYYAAGQSTQAIISDIASGWGIPLIYNYPSITHAKQVFRSQTICDMMTTVLDLAQDQSTGDYVVKAEKGVLHVEPKGSNTDTCIFTGRASVESITNKLTMDDLITKVVVIGKEDDDGRSPVNAILEGDTKFGTIQDIVQQDDDTTLDAAVTQAKSLLQKNGALKQDTSVDTVDVPFLRKGDKVKIQAGTLNGYYYVTGVTHDALNHKMTMQVETVTKATVPITGAPVVTSSSSSSSSTYSVGDSVTLNGAVYATSYGEGKGKTFSGYKCTISRIVDTSRACPYLVDTDLGWVSSSEITHA